MNPQEVQEMFAQYDVERTIADLVYQKDGEEPENRIIEKPVLKPTKKGGFVIVGYDLSRESVRSFSVKKIHTLRLVTTIEPLPDRTIPPRI